MLGTRGAVHAAERETTDLQCDTRYRSLARQLHEYLILSYKQGHAWPSAKHLQKKLGIDRDTVSKNLNALRRLGLVEIGEQAGPRGVNLVSPLPRGKGKRSRVYAAWAANAWGCKALDLNYRVIWYLTDASFRGEVVTRSLGDMATAFKVAKRQNVWTALQKNIARGRLAEVSSTGRRAINRYKVLGATFCLLPEDEAVAKSGVMVKGRLVAFDDPDYLEKVYGD
jgi:DNA-binding MarR family transcriptional regulator